MKNLILTSFCLLTIHSYCQTFRGDIGLGGQAGGGYNKSEDDKYFSIGIAPDIGYFLFDNILVGTQLSYSYSFYEFNAYPGTPESSHLHGISLGPMIRYYLPITRKWRGIMHAGYDWYWTIDIDNGETYKHTDFELGVGAGYFIAENVALEGMFYNKRDQDIIFQAGLQVYIVRNRSKRIRK